MSRLTRTAIAVGGVAVATAALTLSATTANAAPTTHGYADVCAQNVPAGTAACQSKVVTLNGHPMTFKSPVGYGPTDIKSAYNLSGASGAGKTVAIVDAYDNPNAESDLAIYRSNNGLAACTTANGCFKKVNQTGGSSYPAGNTGWGLEIALDVDTVSATCPDCHILLVEATSSTFGNLGTAVNYAASQGVAAISNSYSGGDQAEPSAYNHPGIAITASTGDNGYGIGSPASGTHVIAVGGTTLNHASNARGWKETAWSGAGSGCSLVNAKPSWQTNKTQCSGKASADVSAVADPNTGLGLYDTYGYGGWLQVGGTSLSSPLIASVYAMGGNLSGYPASYTWAHTGNLYDIKSGSNGSCTPSKWCNAQKGWDGPTGLGTPNGVGGF